MTIHISVHQQQLSKAWRILLKIRTEFNCQCFAPLMKVTRSCDRIQCTKDSNTLQGSLVNWGSVCNILTGYHEIGNEGLQWSTLPYLIKPFHSTGSFQYPLKTSQILTLFDYFKGYRKRSVALNGLMIHFGCLVVDGCFQLQNLVKRFWILSTDNSMYYSLHVDGI